MYQLRFGQANDCSSRVFEGNYAVLREANNTLANGQPLPVVIIEMANLDSTADRNWLGTGTAQTTKLTEMANAIYNGIVDWHNANN